MSEQIFNVEVKGDAVYGIWHRPGPHDMLVKMARCLVSNGYNCFRFDFRGKGYSQGDRRNTNNYSMTEDLDAVLRFVNSTLYCPVIVLIGICSGAKLALYYARNGSQPITHVIELSSPVLRSQEVNSVLAVNQVKNTTNEYLNKVFNRQTWYRLVKGEIQFFAIWRNILKPISRFFAGKRKMRSSKTHKSKFPQKPFDKFQGQVLLIHGEKDPETKPALQQIQDMLHHHHVK